MLGMDRGVETVEVGGGGHYPKHVTEGRVLGGKTIVSSSTLEGQRLYFPM